MDKKASITALMSAFARAYHVENAETPAFEDKTAKRLFTDEEYAGMKSYIADGAEFFLRYKPLQPEDKAIDKAELVDLIVNTQLAPTPAARAAYCESCLKTAVKTGTKQYVILGAGYDTFAWRESELMQRLSVFEADHPLTQADKQSRLCRAGLDMPQNLHFVPVDFTKDSLKQRLVENGFDLSEKTFFSWLGVSYYLSEEQIRGMLSELASFAAEGSTIVFDYADEELFSSDDLRVKNMTEMAKAGGEPMKFCCDSFYLAKLLEEHGFLIYEEMTPADIDADILKGTGLTAFPHINYVTAVIKNTGRINTKEKILQTALRLFAQRGYQAVSVRDISGELGITQAALYKHYLNKQDIFDSIIKRMEQRDTEMAAKYDVPQYDCAVSRDEYKQSDTEKLKSFSLAMFRYWTEDAFASSFRKMLTIEQYRSVQMSELYEQYLSSGPLGYVTDILREGGCKRCKEKALAFYAPMFMLMNMYDGAEDKTAVYDTLKKHIERFSFE